MHRQTQCLIFFLSLLLPRYFEASPQCRLPVAKAVSVQGKVDIHHSDVSEWSKVQVDDSFCPGDTIRTEKWSRVTLVLGNNSLVTLDQNTTMVFSEPARDATNWFIKLIEGASFFRSRQPQRLHIQTPFVNAVHEGTEFLVQVSSRQAQISVFDGLVAAENKLGRAKVGKGYSVTAADRQAPRLQALVIRSSEAVQWALYYPPVIDYHSINTESSHLQPALAAYRQGDVNQALSLLESVPFELRNDSYQTLKSSLLLSVGRVDDVRLLAAGSEAGAKAPWLALRSIMAIVDSRQEEALVLAKQAESRYPASAITHVALSYAYQSLFNIQDALAHARRATELSPNNALALARLSELLLSTGERKAARQAARQAEILNPNLARTQTVLGFANLSEVRIEDAREAFARAISLDSSDPLPHLGLALALIRKGDLEAGTRQLETAVQLDANNAILRSYLGKAYYEARNKEFAGTEFNLAKEMDSKDPTPWFYDAILKQTTNRPIEALQDMQKAIELNDNRGVYRSRLLLDEDVAARQAGLGRIFSGLGFDDVANRQAIKALANDPSNYSAHRLLSDSDASKPRQEFSRASEYLQSQLLQPVNYNPIPPSLAYTDLNIIRGIGPAEATFNEYNRLFERNGVRLTTTGIYGSFDTVGDEASLAGIYDHLSFSLGQLHYNTDGFRENNGLKHDLYNAFAQYEISPELNVQAEYRHRETEHGDLELSGESQDFDPLKSRRIAQDTYRYGARWSPGQHSDLLLSFIHAHRTESTVQGFGTADLNGSIWSYDLETQYLYHDERFNVVAGGGMFRNENDHVFNFSSPLICGPFTPNCNVAFDNNVSQYFGYLYSNVKLARKLNVTTGLSYDHFRDKGGKFSNAKLNEVNPKLGFIWQATDDLALRGAFFKSVKSAIVDNQILQPSQIAGFNQFFDDLNGTSAWNYGIGLDSHFHQDVYAGLEASWRELRIPFTVDHHEQAREELYRLYFNWTVTRRVSVNSEFRFENYRNENIPFPSSVETAFIPVEIRYFHPTGFFTSVKGTYVNQNTELNNTGGQGFDSDFYLVDAAVGYRFPKQYGLLSLEAKNLFDTEFVYRDRQFQMNEQRLSEFIPERQLFARMTLNF